MTVETEWDVLNSTGTGYAGARQPDSSSFRDWEIAGART